MIAMLRRFRCDLHIHTCLSPCGDLTMSPRAIADAAVAQGLDLIAICDHNASGNVPYVIEAARGRPLVVIPGMEVTSSEEVHTLALFDNLDRLSALQRLVDDHLFGTNREEMFGCQAIVNELDYVEGFEEKFLLGATTISLADLIKEIHLLDGLAIASHIDRESYSVLSQLGFISPDCPFDALEVTRRMGRKRALSEYQQLAGYPFLESSDAHNLEEIGRGRSLIVMTEGTIPELKMALNNLSGRRIED